MFWKTQTPVPVGKIAPHPPKFFMSYFELSDWLIFALICLLAIILVRVYTSAARKALRTGPQRQKINIQKLSFLMLTTGLAIMLSSYAAFETGRHSCLFGRSFYTFGGFVPYLDCPEKFFSKFERLRWWQISHYFFLSGILFALSSFTLTDRFLAFIQRLKAWLYTD